jgi:predicted nuclease of predicted toxin-antitoxin system
VIRVLLDQGLPRSAVELLRADGWDAVHVFECGLGSARDEQILEYARASGYVVCTLDADFHSMLAVSGSSGPSVVRVRREGLRGPELASLLKRIWDEVGDAIKDGAAVTITDRAVRVRRLPIVGNRAGSNP